MSTLFLDNKLYQIKQKPNPLVALGLAPAYSVAWCCPACGEVWARKVVDSRQFFFLTVPCPKHEDALLRTLMVPGSLLVGGEVVLDELPPELVTREFEAHIKHFERRQ